MKRFALTLVIATALIPLCSHAQEKSDGVDLVVYQVRGAEGAKLEIPKVLQPFAKKLKRTLKQKFSLVGSASTIRVTADKEVVIPMPEKLGSVHINYDAKGKRIRVDFIRGKKKLGSVTSAKYPLMAVDDKLKLGDDQYILIIAKAKKK